MRLLCRQAGFAPWKLVFPGTVIMSEQLCGMFGLDPNSVSMPLPEYIERYNEADRGKLLHLIAQALEGTRGFHSRLRVDHPRTGERMIESFADLRVRDGRVIELFGLSRDVTADMHRETASVARSRLWQDVIANMPAPIVLLDTKLRIMDCNNYWLRCHRKESKKEVQGRAFNELFADAPSEIRADFQRALRGEVVQTRRQFINSVTNRPMTCNTAVAPWYISGNRIGGVMSLIGWSEFGMSKMTANQAAPPPPHDFASTLLEMARKVS